MAGSLGNLFFKIGADVKDAATGITQIERKIQDLSKSFGTLGKGLFAAASFAGVLDVAKQAIQASIQLEKAFLKIKNLTDSSAADMKLYKASLSGISSSLGVSINDLADGLYNVTSAGASGARAIQTLEIASKGAAVGMGSTEEIAKTLTSTLNAYGENNLTAARAAEIFFKTTKSGALDIKELTGSMSSVTPLASALGVSLEQVGAFLATVSLKGTNASEAVTQLASIMTAIINPSSEAKRVMDAIGLSMDELQAMIKADFKGAMLELEKRFAGSAEAMAKFFGRKEAVIGFLSVIGGSAAKYGSILEDIQKDTSLLDAATEEAMNTIEGRWNRAVAVWKKALIVLGDILATTTLIATDAPSYLDEAANLEKVNEAIRQQRKEVIGLIAEKNKLANRFGAGNTYNLLSAPGGPTAKGLFNPLPGPKVDTKVIDDYSRLRAEIYKLFNSSEKTTKSANTLGKAINSLNETLDYWDQYTVDLVKEQDQLNVHLLDQNQLSRANTQAILDNVKAKNAQLAIDRALGAGGERTPVAGLGPPGQESIPEIIKGIGRKDLENLTKIFETEGVDKYTQAVETLRDEMEKTHEIANAIGAASADAFFNLGSALVEGASGFRTLGLAALDAAGQIIKAALAAAIAEAISKSIKKSPHIIVGLALAAVAIGAVKALFSKVPKLGGGGLAYKPQLAIVGDNPNAASDPEVISPLSKLNTMLANQINSLAALLTRSFNQSLQSIYASPASPQIVPLDFRDISVNVKGKIEGNDIRLIYDRAASTNSKFQPRYY